MADNPLFPLTAIIALLPASLLTLRRDYRRDGAFWAVLAVAAAGPLVWVLVHTAGAWRADFSTSLWITVAATMVLFVAVAALTEHGWRLTPLLVPYMLVLAVLATLWRGTAMGEPAATAWGAWTGIHIVVSVVTYGLLTMAAVGALAAVLQERALKRKRPTALTGLLPPVVECDRLLVRLLGLSELVLALGLATGVALRLSAGGGAVGFDHKTVLAVAAFVVIGVLLAVHYRSGLRGRKAARLVLVAYLLLTLGYPGVKFVTDVLVG